MGKWNWQLGDWPEFKFDASRFAGIEEEFLLRSGEFFGAYLHINKEKQEELRIDLLSEEAFKTSEIEGEYLDRKSVQSSIQRHLGLSSVLTTARPAESGIAEMVVDLYRNFEKPLSNKQLFTWHFMVMKGRKDLKQIGSYRLHNSPMQVVSGRIDKPTIHFEAPPSEIVLQEMKKFIEWFNSSLSLPALTRASIAHLYFESIHPFEDGNGRIGRLISEKALAQSLGKPAMLSLSKTIQENRKMYYSMLEESNKSNQIDAWIDYFSKTILAAQKITTGKVEFVIKKNKFYEQHELNSRQDKAIARMFREGAGGFKGGLSAENYISITKTSRATATRDLNDLVGKGALTKEGKGKGTRYFLSF